jgi:hypothetical protein
MFKWREIDEIRNVKKITRVVEMFKKKIAKGKIYLEIEVFGKQRSFKFYKFMPSSLPGNYRSIFIKKDIDDEAGKSNVLVDDITRNIGKISYCRSNYKTCYLEEYVIKALYSEVVEEKFRMKKRKKKKKFALKSFQFMKLAFLLDLLDVV